MENRIDLKQLTLGELEEFMISGGEKSYRARQISKWVFERGVSDFALMTDLGKELRERLSAISRITVLRHTGSQSSSDGTVKFLYGLDDGLAVESVWIPDGKRRTLCVSTQAGCKLNCAFCLTGKNGFRRNLRAAEIVDQVIQSRAAAPDGRVTNVVLMGMGEPLDNYDNTLRALRVMTEPDYHLIGARKITLSTAGVAPGIRRLGEDFPGVKLAVSLNSCDDAVRSRIMPINKKYPLAELRKALAAFPLPKGKRITLEYVLLSGVNDSAEDAQNLASFARGLKTKINLIPFNQCAELPYESPPRKTVENFQKLLTDSGFSVFIRASRGGDILAACGQLAGEGRTSHSIQL